MCCLLVVWWHGHSSPALGKATYLILWAAPCTRGCRSSTPFFFFTLVTGPRRSLRLKLSDTRVYEPQIRAQPRCATSRTGCGRRSTPPRRPSRPSSASSSPLASSATVAIHPGDNIRANGPSQKWTRPGMPTDSGGILRGCPLLGGAVCPNVVSRVALSPQPPFLLFVTLFQSPYPHLL